MRKSTRPVARYALAMSPLRLMVLCALIAHVEAGAAGQPGGCPCPGFEPEVLREVIAGINGYRTAAFANQPRFVADLLLNLADRAEARGWNRFCLDPERFITAWRDATGSSGPLPPAMAQVLHWQQHFAVEIDPDLAHPPDNARRWLAVSVQWPEDLHPADEYRYIDRSSRPEMELRYRRRIHYLLVDLGTYIAYERVEGVRGRPVSGLFSLPFRLFGPAPVRSIRFTIVGGGVQLNRAEVGRLLPMTVWTRISPDGVAERLRSSEVEPAEAPLQEMDQALDLSPPDHWPEACIAPAPLAADSAGSRYRDQPASGRVSRRCGTRRSGPGATSPSSTFQRWSIPRQNTGSTGW